MHAREGRRKRERERERDKERARASDVVVDAECADSGLMAKRDAHPNSKLRKDGEAPESEHTHFGQQYFVGGPGRCDSLALGDGQVSPPKGLRE